jgi:glyoxylase-like metal-dependent hydrolase (beta-lactamase superfamily II)
MASATDAISSSANVGVIVNDHDVILVDNGTTPAATRALLQDLRTITDKPVRSQINTHYHYDHTDGNQVFAPDVQIIGHESARRDILTRKVLERDPYENFAQVRVPARIAALKKEIAGERDPGALAVLEQQLRVQLELVEDLKEIKPTPPNTVFSSSLTLFRGEREIRLLFLGRGHTAGDVVVYLPRERIVMTGDLLQPNLPFMGDGYFDEWVATIDAVKQLDFTVVLPGHGAAIRDRARIESYQGYLRDLTAQAASLRKQGLTADQAAERVDLTKYSAHFPAIRGPGADVRAVRRIYEWMDERTR